MVRLKFIIGILFSSFIACTPSGKINDKEIIILHVNDIHGKIDKIPAMAYLVDSIRKTHPNVLLVSAGDLFSGNPVVDKHTDPGFPIIALMNELKFELTVPGNHEFDYGPEILQKRISQAHFPFLAANIQKQPFHAFISDTEIVIDHARLKFIGLTQVSANGIPDTHPDKVKDFSFTDGIEYAHNYTNTDTTLTLIALSHMGIEKDSILATQYPQFKLIIGGHSHKKISPPMKVRESLIVQADHYLDYLGVTTLLFSKNGVLKEIRDTLLEISENTPVDSTILKMVTEFNKAPYLYDTLGYINLVLKGDEEIGCFMAEAYKSETGTDLAFQNSGGVRIQCLKKGPVLKKTIYELDPFNNELISMKMNINQIKKLIINGYKKENGIDLRPAGLSYTLSIKNGEPEVEISGLNTLDESKLYSVVVNSYIFNTYQCEYESATPLGLFSNTALSNFIKNGKQNNYKVIERTKFQ